MADGPRCKRRKQANPRRKNGKNRPEPNFSGPLRGSRPGEKGGKGKGTGAAAPAAPGARGRASLRGRRPSPARAAAGPGGVGEVRGKVSAGSGRGPAPPARRPPRPRPRPPSTSAARPASSWPAGSPAAPRERPAGAGRGPGGRGVQDPGAGAGVAQGRRGRERGPRAVPLRGVKFLPGVAGSLSLRQVTVRGQRGPAGRARTAGWEGLGRPGAGSGGVRAGSGAGGSSPAGSGPSPGGWRVEGRRETFLDSFYVVRRSPLSRLSQEGRRWGCEGETQEVGDESGDSLVVLLGEKRRRERAKE